MRVAPSLLYYQCIDWICSENMTSDNGKTVKTHIKVYNVFTVSKHSNILKYIQYNFFYNIIIYSMYPAC